MKKRHAISVLGILALFSFSSCDNAGPCLRGNGPVVEETRSIPSFDRVKMDGSMEILLIPDSIYSVDLFGQENILDRIETEVVGDQLRINMDGCITKFKDVRAEVHAPIFRGLTIKGSGNATSQETLETDVFDLFIDGSGDVTLAIETDDMDTDINGSGDVTLTGSATNQSIQIRGSGKMQAFDFDTEASTVRVNGSGDIRLRTNNTLDVTIDGAGNIYYKGFPTITKDINGSGNLIDAN